jgi:hypothetical protein
MNITEHWQAAALSALAAYINNPVEVVEFVFTVFFSSFFAQKCVKSS